MRVLLINKFHYLKGGAERAYFDTAQILTENGHTVACFSMAHPDNVATPWSRFFVSSVDYHDAQAGSLSKLRAAMRIVWNQEAANKLDALIREFKPDVAHLHNFYHQLSPSILWTLRRHRVRSVMTLHDYKLISPNYNLLVHGQVWDETSGWRAIIDRAVQGSYLKSAVCAVEQWVHRALGSFALVDAYMAPSQFLIERFRAAGFPYPIRHVVQPILPFPDVPVRSGDEKHLLFIGRLSTEKGIETLLGACALMPEVRLTIIGTGPEEAALRDRAKHLPNITFLGYQMGEIWEKTLRGARALVLPSLWYENMPYVLLEALSRGVPVIASRIGGIPERIREGENGFLFQPGDVDDLGRAIRDCLRHPDPDGLSRRAYASVADAQPATYYQSILSIYQPEQFEERMARGSNAPIDH